MNIEGENKMPLCKFCDENHLELRHETKKVTLKGIEVEYDHKFFYCPDLEEEFEEGDLIDENLNAARNAYRKKVSLLTSDEIKAIKEYLIKEADRIKKDSIYQAFYPLKTLPNHKNNSFTVEGLLKSMTGNVMIEEKKAQITFDYKVTNKKLVIKKFEVRK